MIADATLIERLLALPQDDRHAVIAQMTNDEALSVLYDWRVWARPKQLAPPGRWTIWLNMGGRGAGKALALDTPIPIPDGWTTMGALRVGDEVFDERGLPCRVTFATGVQANRSCYRVSFDDGSYIVADAEHRWLTWDHAARKSAGRRKQGQRSPFAMSRAQNRPRHEPTVRDTAEIAKTLYYLARERNHSIPVAGALECGARALPVAPYVLGAWLGDGSSAAAEITIGDRDAVEILALLAADGEVVTGPVRRKSGAKCATYPIGGLPTQRDPLTGRMLSTASLHSRLRQLGVMKNKHIPAAYLRASVGQRLALLRGLMDTDGSATRANAVEFCTTNAVLARGVLELARSLGLKASSAESRATVNGRDVGPRWRITWSSRLPVFRLPRKLSRARQNAAQRTRTTHRYIVAVEPVESVPVRCITVDSPSHLYLAGDAMVPTHNTRVGAEWINAKAKTSKTGRLALIGQTYSDIVDTMLEGESGVLTIASPDFRPEFRKSKQRIIWPNGAQAKLFSAEKPRRLRGPQHEYVWADEIASWQYPRETYDMLVFGLRIGPHPQLCITTTPKPIELLIELMKDAVICWSLRDATPGAAILRQSIGVVVSSATSYENVANLSEEWFNRTIKPYEGTRLGDQEILARLLTDVPGALWKRELLDETRLRFSDPLPEFKRIVVACDPAVTSASTSAETGIIVVAKGINNHCYVLNDRSGRYTPNGWARELVNAYHHFDADRIIAETNNGGELVKLNVHTVDPNVAYRGVTATRGKMVRSEPVAALYEQRKIHHVGTFGLLETQMTTYVPDSGLPSPDRVDALTWAITDLMLGKQGAFVVVPTGR